MEMGRPLPLFFFFFLMNSCHCFNKWTAYSSFLEYLLNFFFIVVLQVLTEPKNALGKQYKKMFSMNGVSFLSYSIVGQETFLPFPVLIFLFFCWCFTSSKKDLKSISFVDVPCDNLFHFSFSGEITFY